MFGEEAAQEDVEEFGGLFVGVDLAAAEVVEEDGAVEEVAEDVDGLFGGHAAHAALVHELLEAFLPLLATGGAVAVVGGLGAVAKIGSFLDEEFDVLGVFGEMAEEAVDEGGELFEWVAVAFDAGGFDHAEHDVVDRGAEEFALAGEIVVEGSLGAAGVGGNDVEVGAGVAAAGEFVDGVTDDVGAAACGELVVSGPSGPRALGLGFGHGCHHSQAVQTAEPGGQSLGGDGSINMS